MSNSRIVQRLSRLTAAAGLFAGFGTCAAQCPGSWTLLFGNYPHGRQNHAIAFDAARNRVTLFGGFDSLHFEMLADTWTLSGIDWTEVNVGGTAPTPRSSHAMVYDTSRQRIILFGGNDGVRRNDLWEWNGTAWSQVTTTNPPSGRQSHSMCYDSIRQRVVLFGGMDGSGAVLGETWEYNPATSTWLQLNPAVAPSGRYDTAIAFDSARARTVLFGGQTALNLNDNTWEWNGTTWAPIFTSAQPEARAGHTMIYDSARHVCVLFGGATFSAFMADTWERGAGDWTDVTASPSPAPRYYHAMTFDAARAATVVYAGSNGNGPYIDTWERVCPCYANCDASTISPILNVGDFICFLNNFAAQTPYANCDGSTTAPVLNVLDFTCFLNKFAAGC